MSDHAARLALKQRLPRTWPAFFDRHGNFTLAQLRTIPLLLEGANVLLCAPTASGKTEAALAPLLERHCPPSTSPTGPSILYLTPTKALVTDLTRRLAQPLAALGITLGSKTRDSTTFRPEHPPQVLITTPESTDALLASRASLFARLQAIVLDECHLYAATARGDHVRIVLNRLRSVRDYAAAQGDAPAGPLQLAALSATLAQPAGLAEALQPAQIVQIPGQRRIEMDWIELESAGTATLAEYLVSFRARNWRKALIFCNSRAEVEAYAAALRQGSPFGTAVFAHYSNLAPQRRRSVEQQFAQAEAAVCVASSTLELGIDIGDIDVVILIGAPGSQAALLQRAGRGNRRQQVTQLACGYRTPLERQLFAALLAAPPVAAAPPSPFRPAVAIQQIFSLLKQSPTGAVRLAELAQLFSGMMSADDLLLLLGHLHQRDYLRMGRPGDWCAGPQLLTLLDQQTKPDCALSIYSNVTTTSGPQLEVRDQHTHEVVARVDARWLDRPQLTLEGRAVAIEWQDGQALWVATDNRHAPPAAASYRSACQTLSFELAGQLAHYVGLPAGAAPFVATANGWSWFHWLGDSYGRVLFELLRPSLPVRLSSQPGLWLDMDVTPQPLPAWSAADIARQLERMYQRLEPLFDLGPFQHLLPPVVRRRSVLEQFKLERFMAALAELRPIPADEALAERLGELLA